MGEILFFDLHSLPRNSQILNLDWNITTKEASPLQNYFLITIHFIIESIGSFLKDYYFILFIIYLK